MNISDFELENNPKYSEISNKRKELEEDNFILVSLSDEVPTLEVLKEKGKDVLYNQIACKIWENEQVLQEIEQIIDIYAASESFVLLEVMPFLFNMKAHRNSVIYSANKMLEYSLDFIIEGYFNKLSVLKNCGMTPYYKYAELYIKNKLNDLFLLGEGSFIFIRDKLADKVDKEILNFHSLGMTQFEKIFYFLNISICTSRNRDVIADYGGGGPVTSEFCNVGGLIAFDDISFFIYGFIYKEFLNYLNGYAYIKDKNKENKVIDNFIKKGLEYYNENVDLLYENIILDDTSYKKKINLGNKIIEIELNNKDSRKLLPKSLDRLAKVYLEFEKVFASIDYYELSIYSCEILERILDVGLDFFDIVYKNNPQKRDDFNNFFDNYFNYYKVKNYYRCIDNYAKFNNQSKISIYSKKLAKAKNKENIL